MSDGGIGEGLAFWVTFKISGTLKEKQLKRVTQEIRDILNARVTDGNTPQIKRNSANGDKINGEIIQAARATGVPEITVTVKPAPRGRNRG